MKHILISLIRLYKTFISPLIVTSCRFHPSCSSYAIEAIETHGSLKGSYLATKRLLKCSPLSRGGIDTVPRKGHL